MCIRDSLPLERFQLSRRDALDLMADQPYKQELIGQLGEGDRKSVV